MNNNKLSVLVKRLTKLIKEFQKLKELTPEEFISQKYNLIGPQNDSCNHFLFLMKHKEFFDKVVEIFLNHYNLRLNAEVITVLYYFIIFILNKDNWKEVSKMLIELQFKYSLNVVEYVLVEENVIDITQAACKIFDNDYVLENVVNPLLTNKELLENILFQIHEDVKTRTAIPKKPLTIPIPPKCLTRPSYTPIVPTNSIEEIAPYRSTLKTTQKQSNDVNQELDKAFKANREKAQKLLEFARDNAFNCAKTPKRIVVENVHSTSYVVKYRKPPPKKHVVIKGTTASLMREAALIVKNKESEIQKIDALIKGAFDPAILENLDNEIRLYKEQQHLQEIEKKHLQGLLTYEEAKLAKQNVVQENKLKMEEFKKEREHILEEIEAWKEEEQKKIKLLVEKCQNIEKAAREAEEKMFQNKKMQAKMIDNETRDILREAYEKKQRELAEKVKLIQELRALQQVRTLQIKEFDPTETPNFGLLCEMSIAELQERLGLLKMQLQEELEKKKNNILENKKRQQCMIENMKVFIKDNKGGRIKRVPKTTCKLQLTPEIVALRERLENLKQCNKVNELQADIFHDA